MIRSVVRAALLAGGVAVGFVGQTALLGAVGGCGTQCDPQPAVVPASYIVLDAPDADAVGAVAVIQSYGSGGPSLFELVLEYPSAACEAAVTVRYEWSP